MATKYDLPGFLDGILSQEEYIRWLSRKAMAHVKRDRRRWGECSSVSTYKEEIHEAVLRSKGLDHYTEEKLNWSLLSQYDNDASREGRVAYKKLFALLPTVDHVDLESREADFEICGWRTNDCKNDLSLVELKRFCRKLLKAQGG